MKNNIQYSEWIEIGKQKGFHDYYKDMVRIAVENEIEKIKCACDENYILKNGYGTGYNQVVLNCPDWLYIADKKTIGVDKCLADEILSLWDKGIKTRGCCCGHNLAYGYIQVEDEEDKKKMIELGYRKYYYGGQQHKRDDAFLPKTLFKNLKYIYEPNRK